MMNKGSHKNSNKSRARGKEIRWRLRAVNEDLVEYLAKSTGCLPETARILAARGITGIRDFRAFLHPSIQDLPHPDGMKDLAQAGRRIVEAILKNEKILVFGDYDADGITATVLLYGFLSRLCSNVSFCLPHREKEGYGLSPEQVSRFSQEGFSLVITVDCGITSLDAAKKAKKEGIDLIVTDHHRPGERLPCACAIVDPGRADCESGLHYLAGVGVAFYFIMALRKELRLTGFFRKIPEPRLLPETDLVAIGTVADLVPLTGINRFLVNAGLAQIRGNPRPGIEALCRVAGFSYKEMDSEQIAFRIGPRINAAGRMAHPEIAAKLLLAPSLETAMPLAMELDRLNAARQNEENRILSEIETLLSRKPEILLNEVLVFKGENWPLGTIGISASRLAKKFHKPAILISIKNGLGFASARSIPGFDLYLALTHCRDFLEQFGGHAMAAGFRILHRNISSFERSICKFAAPFREIIGESPPLLVDAFLSLETLSPKILEEMEKIGPFGMGNPLPLFVAKNLDVLHERAIGKDEAHKRLVLRQAAPPGRKTQAVLFCSGKDTVIPKRLDTCLFHLRKAWGKTGEVEIQIEAWE